ncbi:hypothetical protein J6590_059931 [Homalodisca vitripennis]|nr:hypothetical protein J6590_059931 [Homalodisca vitripennis]
MERSTQPEPVLLYSRAGQGSSWQRTRAGLLHSLVTAAFAVVRLLYSSIWLIHVNECASDGARYCFNNHLTLSQQQVDYSTAADRMSQSVTQRRERLLLPSTSLPL